MAIITNALCTIQDNFKKVSWRNLLTKCNFYLLLVSFLKLHLFFQKIKNNVFLWKLSRVKQFSAKNCKVAFFRSHTAFEWFSENRIVLAWKFLHFLPEFFFELSKVLHRSFRVIFAKCKKKWTGNSNGAILTDTLTCNAYWLHIFTPLLK